MEEGGRSQCQNDATSERLGQPLLVLKLRWVRESSNVTHLEAGRVQKTYNPVEHSRMNPVMPIP